MRALRVVVGSLACAVLGAVVGLLGAFQHAAVWSVGSVDLPVGVLAGIAALLLAELVARDAGPLGLGPAIVLIAWLGVVALLGTSRPEGDLAVPAGAAGETFLYGGFLAGLLLAVTLALSGATAGRRASR